jgi:predicted CopG family antitoxin
VTMTTASAVRRRSKLKRIVVSEHNYLALKNLGHAGDSFNDVISKLLRIERNYQEKKQQEQESTDANSSSSSNSGLLFPPNHSTMFAQQDRQQVDELVRLLRRKERSSRNNQTIKQESNKQEPAHTGNLRNASSF